MQKFLGKSTCSSDGNMKVIFNDFPRGVECFELVSRFATATVSSLRQLMDALVEKLELSPSSAASACSPSPDSSLLRFSCDSKSTESFKNGSSRIPWWFTRKFDNLTISRFLFYYQKVKLCSESCNEKREILETIIHTLYVLDRSCVRHKSLFGLELMIGQQLDQATLDNLLVPSPLKSSSRWINQPMVKNSTVQLTQEHTFLVTKNFKRLRHQMKNTSSSSRGSNRSLPKLCS
ncbi:hypothetical protein HID58_002864 [Brassica napus]|uniref:Uncharacterized protein n=1 Tax=Brassica napus TaxID=3708 RepID=A0ABQ8ENG5_BRANA|nr:hypothetical protein HID58_002864 [Brassica napus]